jgi:hypothetical protein
MRNDVKRNWDWANKFLAETGRVIRKVFSPQKVALSLSTPKMDMKESTDALVKVNGGEYAIALRVRRPEQDGWRDLTIRSYNGGHKTELQKIKEGNCDFYLYAWTSYESAKDGTFSDWVFIDLNIMRLLGIFDEDWDERKNKDGITAFVVKDIWELMELDAIVYDESLNRNIVKKVVINTSLPPTREEWKRKKYSKKPW